MSREIDFSKPLSEEDLAYVADRPWLKQDAELSGLSVEGGAAPEADEDEVAPEEESVEDEADEDDEDESEDEAEADEDEVATYEEWSFAELKEEAEKRNLSKAGSKEQLVERLEASDEEVEEAE